MCSPLIQPVVRKGLFSPGEKDETEEELPLRPHIIYTVRMCVFLCVHAFLNMMLQISYERERNHLHFSYTLCLVSYTLFEFLYEMNNVEWNWNIPAKVQAFFSKEKNRSIVITDVEKFSEDKPRCSTHSFQLLRETYLSVLLVNRGGWVIPVSFQPQLEIRYSISCPQICSVVN